MEQEDERTTVEQPPEATPVGPAAPQTAREPATSTGGGGRIVDEHWDDGTTVDEATMAQAEPPGAVASPDDDGAEEMTVDEPGKAVTEARLMVIAGNDTGREFVLAPSGKPLSVGRAMDNDIVLTDIAVSRKHLDVVWEGGHWVLKDRGSGNGTLLNERIEDGSCRLQHGDRIEIGHTIFRFDHPSSAAIGPPISWSHQQDDEASTVAGRSPPRPGSPPDEPATNVSQPRRTPSTSAPPPPGAAASGIDRKATLPPPRPRTPSQGPHSGAVSSRLALPPNPSAIAAPPPVDDVARTTPAPRTAEPLLLIAPAAAADPMRQSTATAHVAPLTYATAGASASMPMVAYRSPPLVASRRRSGLIAAAIGGGVALIGVLAMVLGGDEPRGRGAAGTSVTARDGATDGAGGAPVPDPVAKEPIGVPPDPVRDPVTVDDRDDRDDVAIEVKDPEPVAKQPDPVEVKDPEPVVKKPDPVVKKPDPVVKKPDPVVRKKPDPVVRKKPDPVVRKPDTAKKPTSADAAKKKAAALYADKDFKAAAAVARDAASSAEGADAAALRSLAGTYDQLASSIAAGNAAAASKPTDALTAYKRALAADKKLGGTHAPMIREKLGQVAPKAAAGFMAKGNYEAAKQAADTAVNFGAGSSPTIAQVRQSLERKAAELYASGVQLMKSKPDDGKAILRRVLKIVPPDSPSYQKAYKAVNTRSKQRDDDE